MKASNASGSAIRAAVYARPSARLVGGIGGRSGHRLKAPRVLRHSTRCSGVLSLPHEQDRFRGARTSYQFENDRSRNVADSIESVSKGRAFGRTAEHGLFGWVPKNSVTGDVVAILTGGTMPVVLRPQNGYYTVVGDAYVHGVMDGEAVPASTTLEYLELH